MSEEVKTEATIVVLRPVMLKRKVREVGEVVTLPFSEAFHIVNSNSKNPKALPFESKEEKEFANPRVEARKKAIARGEAKAASRNQPAHSERVDVTEATAPLQERINELELEIKQRDEVQAKLDERISALESAKPDTKPSKGSK